MRGLFRLQTGRKPVPFFFPVKQKYPFIISWRAVLIFSGTAISKKFPYGVLMSVRWVEYELDARAVGDISESIRLFLENPAAERRNVLRIRLTMEELLLRIIDSREQPVHACLGLGKQYGRPVVTLKYDGEPFDPTEGEAENWNTRILASAGLSPTWSYRGGQNRLSLRLPASGGHGTLFYILTAIACAVILGFAGRFLPETLKTGINEALLTPLMEGFLGLLNTFAGVMIAFTVCSGVLGVGDSAAVGKIGKSLLIRLFVITLIISAGTLGFASVFADLNYSSGAAGWISRPGQILGMIFGILPKDPVSPFLNCNTMQIIVIALFFGIGMLTLGSGTNHLRDVVGEITDVTQFITSSVCRLVPIFVFAALLRLIWSGSAAQLFSLWKPFVLIIAAGSVTTVIMLVFTGMQLKCSPLMLLKKLMPPFLVAFTTASSMSAFSVRMETCEKKLGADRSFLEFSLPIGSVVFKPRSLCLLSVLACSFAEIYGLEVNPAWFIMAWLSAALLSVAGPPIPGAALTIYGFLFSQLGIPADAMLLATALDVLVDFFVTGFNVLLLDLELVRQAGLMDCIDRRRLMKEAGQ